VDAAGRANVAYADDSATPGSATVDYVRQNGGLSALDGAPLPNLHFVLPKFNLGNSCPGPEVLDPYDDAPGNAFASPAASNVDNFDIRSVDFQWADAKHVRITLT